MTTSVIFGKGEETVHHTHFIPPFLLSFIQWNSFKTDWFLSVEMWIGRMGWNMCIMWRSIGMICFSTRWTFIMIKSREMVDCMRVWVASMVRGTGIIIMIFGWGSSVFVAVMITLTRSRNCRSFVKFHRCWWEGLGVSRFLLCSHRSSTNWCWSVYSFVWLRGSWLHLYLCIDEEPRYK